MSRPTLIFDLDDTLVETHPIYAEAKNTFVRFEEGRGRDAQLAAALLRLVDGEMLRQRPQFDRARFPRSMAATSLALDALAGETPDLYAADLALEIGNDVYRQEYRVYPGVEVALTKAVTSGWQVAVLTIGDPHVQRRKLLYGGLWDFFSKTCFIGVMKTPDVYRSTLEQLGTTAEDAWMVGDSTTYDIEPAMTAGLRTVRMALGTLEHALDQGKAPLQATLTLTSWAAFTAALATSICAGKAPVMV